MNIVKRVLITFGILAVTFLTARAEKFDRGIDLAESPVFMPKGQLMFGGMVSYQDYKFYDYKFLILDDINLNAYSLKATPYIYYSFAKNMAIGVRFSYQRFMAGIGSANLAITPDMQFGVSDNYTIQHTYYGSISYRYYIPIGSSRIFGLFSDISLSVGAGQGKMVQGTGDDRAGTYQNILDVGIDVIPGLAIFIANEISVEASIGILGLSWKRVSQTTNQIYEGSYETSGANFKINLFSINIGVNFVIPVKK